MTTARELLAVSPVIPVVVIDEVDHAVPLAKALARGGIGVIEVTLRTAAGLPAIERIAAEVPEILVGAGTVITPDQVDASLKAGSRFLVTPGTTDSLLTALEGSGVPFLPGAATISEALKLAERGHDTLKFFPAEQSGGTTFLKALSGPLPQLRFCPTGGITVTSARGYLALPNVSCVGGSWLTPKAALAAGDWAAVEKLAAEAAALG
ncbi:bifunctional 4-hydroxy-2-oxoglutarate aldolase/2-dehydro-3-deoxy-phosphogluconate aldolase [Crossiella sp. NPDC003009]